MQIHKKDADAEGCRYRRRMQMQKNVDAQEEYRYIQRKGECHTGHSPFLLNEGEIVSG